MSEMGVTNKIARAIELISELKTLTLDPDVFCAIGDGFGDDDSAEVYESVENMLDDGLTDCIYRVEGVISIGRIDFARRYTSDDGDSEVLSGQAAKDHVLEMSRLRGEKQ